MTTPPGTPTSYIRLAAAADAPAINDVYNYYVARSTCTYQEEPEPLDARIASLARAGPRHPVTVAEVGGRVVGWAALTPFHARSAYRRTVTNAVYVDHLHHGNGIGKALMIDLLDRARAAGHHSVVALIDAGQPGSIALHARLGFVEAGRLREVGHKFGQWLDVVHMQRML